MEEIIEALVGIAVILLVIIVAAVVVTIIIQYVKIYMYTPPPPPQTPNTNDTVHVQIDNGNYEISGLISPNYEIETQYLPQVELPIASGFVIQYGIDGNSNPWVANAGQDIPQDEIGYVSYQDTASNFQYIITLNGIGTDTYYVNNTNATTFYADITNGFTTSSETDDVGDVEIFTPAPYPQSTNAVIIWRSTNLLTWLSISTNQVVPGGVYSFTDTNIFWPSYSTYYNTNTGGGGGGMSPDTNAPSTNGVITVPAGAYYRLAYPSNQSDYITN